MKALVLAALCVVMLSDAPVVAQTKREATPAPFASFWSRFKAAVAKDDREAVASMTKLPFPLDNKELTRAQFIKNYNKMFAPAIKRCFAREKPVRDGETYSIFCGEQGILFERVGGDYKFTSFFAND